MAINVSREISALAPTVIKSTTTTNIVTNLVKYGELSLIYLSTFYFLAVMNLDQISHKCANRPFSLKSFVFSSQPRDIH